MIQSSWMRSTPAIHHAAILTVAESSRQAVPAEIIIDPSEQNRDER